MANLSISAVCNLECPYCFTADHHPQKPFMALEDFESRLDFLDRSGIDQVRLLGGEPTLHPDFPTLIERARARDKKIMVFSNGLMPEKALACLEALPVEVCSVLINVNAPSDLKPSLVERQRATMSRLGARAMPGFNIYRPDFQLDFMLDLIAAAGCKPTIRLGIAQPCLSGKNTFIHPKQYAFIGQRITDFACVAAAQGVTLDFDCGFVPCMFPNLELLKAAGTQTGWYCSPILDIDPEGQVISCYPLAQFASLPLTAEVDACTLRHHFDNRARPYRQAGLFSDCATCRFKAEGECPGGCLAAVMRRFRHSSFSMELP